MRRFEFSDGKSNKFWEIALESNTYTVRYGKMGTDGQTTTKVFDTPDKAARAAEKVIGQKTKKGYAEVDAVAPAPKKGANPELQEAILADPSDHKAWAVLGDWLQSEGDPRGELVALQLAVAADPNDSDLKRKELALIEANKKAWLGDVDGWGERARVQWGYGFWRSVWFGLDWDADLDFRKMLGVVLRHDSAAFLEQLELGLADCEGENYYQDALDSLVKHGIRRGLRTLHVGAFEYPDETEISWTEVGNFNKCWTVLPDLEDLTLTGGSIELGTPSAPKLRRLKLETGGLLKEPAEVLAKASLPALTDLEVWFGTDNYGGECSAEEAAGILANKAGLPSVKRLGLMNADFADDICGVLVGSALLPQLETLDLSMGTMTDAGAQILLDNASAFAHLASLDLEDNYIGEGLVAKLEAALPNVSTGGQDDPGNYGPYVSVGE